MVQTVKGFSTGPKNRKDPHVFSDSETSPVFCHIYVIILNHPNTLYLKANRQLSLRLVMILFYPPQAFISQNYEDGAAVSPKLLKERLDANKG